MTELLSVADLEAAKKHDTFHSEVITGKTGGLAGGADIEYATNTVTGQVQATLPKILSQVGFAPADFDFITGGTLSIADRNKAIFYDTDGNWYSWGGTLPKTIAAASSPATTGGIAVDAWNVSTSAFMYRDWEGFTDELYAQGGIVDDGLPDTLGGSKRVDAIKNLINIGDSSSYSSAMSVLGFSPVTSSFYDGFTLDVINAVVKYSDGNSYVWQGALPKVVPEKSTLTSAGGVGDGAWFKIGYAAGPYDIRMFDSDINKTLLILGKALIYENITLTSDVVISSNQTLACVDSAEITLDVFGVRTQAMSNDTYWKGSAENPLRFLTSSALGGVGLNVDDASGIEAGDKLWVRNGYCDHWRFLGNTVATSVSKYEALRSGPYLGEFVTVESVSGNSIIVRPKLLYSYPLIPVVTGLIPVDENSRADYAGYTTPSVQKLLYKDITVDISVKHSTGKAGYVRLDFVDGLDLKLNSSGDGTSSPWPNMSNNSIFKRVEANSKGMKGANFACISCEGTISGRADFWEGDSDAPFVVMLMSNCVIENINAEHTGIAGERYPAYINACVRGSIRGVTAKNFTAPASMSFSVNILVKDLIGLNCDVACGSFTSVDCSVEDVHLKGYYLVTSFTPTSDSTLYLNGQSKNKYTRIKRVNDLGWGRIFMGATSEGVEIRGLTAPLTYLSIGIGTTSNEQAVGDYSLKLDAVDVDILGINRTSGYYDGAMQNGTHYPRVEVAGILRGNSSLGNNSAFDKYEVYSYGNILLGNASTFDIKGLIIGDLAPVSGSESTCYLKAVGLRVVGTTSGFLAFTAILTTPPVWWYKGQEATDMTTMSNYRYNGNRGGGSLVQA